MPVPTMRFGLVMLREKDPKHPDRLKKLTFDEWGRTNNTCLRVDGKDYLFGQPPGTWFEMKGKLAGETAGRPRDGFASSWFLPGGADPGDARSRDRARRAVAPIGHLSGALYHREHRHARPPRRPPLHARHLHRRQRRRALHDPRRDRHLRQSDAVRPPGRRAGFHPGAGERRPAETRHGGLLAVPTRHADRKPPARSRSAVGPIRNCDNSATKMRSLNSPSGTCRSSR